LALFVRTDYIAKTIIRLINAVSKTINADKEIREYLSVAFLPDYSGTSWLITCNYRRKPSLTPLSLFFSVSLAEILVPAADISVHISTGARSSLHRAVSCFVRRKLTNLCRPLFSFHSRN
jgi:hypothetical protein